MAREHLEQVTESTDKFTTGNYGVTTTSAVEWHFVVNPETEGVLAQLGLERWPGEADDKLPDRSRRALVPMRTHGSQHDPNTIPTRSQQDPLGP